MSFTPSGTVRLINNVPFTLDYSNVLDFNNAADQQAYFYAKLFDEIEEVTYIMKEKSIRVDYYIEDLYGVNYVMYKNKNKWIYAFITDKIYLNDKTTSLIIETDVYQTFMFDYSITSAYVEREHNSRDTIPKVDEGFDLGSEYEIYNKQTVFSKGNYWLVFIGSVKERKAVKNGKTDMNDTIIEYIEIDSGGTSTAPLAPSINGIPYTFYTHVSNTSSLRTIVETLKGCNSIISIVKVSKMPSMDMTDYVTIPYYNASLTKGTMTLNVLTGIKDSDIDTVGTFTQSYDIPSVGATFNPLAENRFKYYPYCYSLLTDYVSEPMKVKHEYLQGTTVKGAFTYTHTPTERFWIEGYCNDNGGKVHNITNESVISLPLANDVGAMMMLNQQNSMAQNQINMKQDYFVGGVNTMVNGIGAMMTNPIGGFVNTMQDLTNQAYNFSKNINNEIARQQDIINQPSSIKTMGRVGNEIGFDINKVDYISFKISDEVKKRIGSYWHYFGYKTMEVKTPNLKSRNDFNYIKCGDITLTSGVDSAFLQQIKNIYLNGVRIWHKPTTYLNYNVGNGDV